MCAHLSICLPVSAEEQARSRTEQLLLEVSVMSSWATEAELSLQVLTKKMKKPNGMTTKLAATREVCDDTN